MVRKDSVIEVLIGTSRCSQRNDVVDLGIVFRLWGVLERAGLVVEQEDLPGFVSSFQG